jgi:hypothetical protein
VQQFCGNTKYGPVNSEVNLSMYRWWWPSHGGNIRGVNWTKYENKKCIHWLKKLKIWWLIFGMKCDFKLINKWEEYICISSLPKFWHSSKYSPTLNFQGSYSWFVTFVISQLAVLSVSCFLFCLMLTFPVCEVFSGVISPHSFSAILRPSEPDKHSHIIKLLYKPTDAH